MKRTLLIIAFLSCSSLSTAIAPRLPIPRIENSLHKLAVDKALKYGLPPVIFSRLVMVESSWRVYARSKSAGARGLTQLMPATAKWACNLNLKDIHRPDKNLDCGARYLAYLYRRFGSLRAALISYNIGPTNYQNNKFIDAGERYINKFEGVLH